MVVASSDSGGAVRLIEVDTATLTATMTGSAVRFGFGRIAWLDLVPNTYWLGTDALGIISTDSGTVAGRVVNEDLADLAAFQVP